MTLVWIVVAVLSAGCGALLWALMVISSRCERQRERLERYLQGRDERWRR